MKADGKITIGILAHVDAGKTTLSEALLYKAGAIRKAGRVDHGDALLDSDSQEKERGITIYAGQAVFRLPASDGAAEGEGVEVTLLDTPGHVDFSAEMERTLKVLDCAVLVVSGRDGIQSHTLTLWKLLRRYGIPAFIFVNKMDLETPGEEEIIERLRSQLDPACCRMDGIAGGNLEEIAMCSEEMLEEYLAGGAVSDSAIAKAVKGRKIFPCYFGSALKMEGVDGLMDGVARFAPLFEGNASADPELRVFRVTRDRQGERLTHLKILSGTLRVRDEIAGEKVNQIRIYSGDKYTAAEEAGPGTVCQVTGPQELLPENDGALEALMVYGVRLPEGVNVHETYSRVRQLGEEDPQLQITWNSQLREIQLKLMGQVQLEVLQEMIKRRFGVDVTFTEGRIAYKETIAGPMEGAGHYEPLRHYAEVHLMLEPLPRGSGMEFGSDLSEDILDRNWQRLIMTHLLEKEHVGTLTGSPITDMRISIIAGKAHEKHTEGGDFRQATYRAIRQGLRKSLAAGEMILLEPYYDFELEVPRETVGRSMADIQRMSGDCGAPEETGGTAGGNASEAMTVLRGRAPVSEMKDYVTEVASYTKGRGRLALSFGGYDVCHNQDEVVVASGYDPDADTEESADSVFCSHGAGHLVSWDKADDMMHVSAARRSGEAAGGGAEGGSSTDTGERRTYPGAQTSAGPQGAEDKELQRIFDRTFRSSKSDKPSIEAREFDSELERRKKAAERRRRAAEAEKRRDEMLLPEYLLVDGYNIIFAWDELKQLAKENIDSARE
ncbi:MAG: NYN domain-containing protein, partial [Bacillota bacterium]